MTLNKFDLQRDVCSLDLLIRAVSIEMVQEPGYNGGAEPQSALVKEMEEALRHMRQARAVRKFLLTALGNKPGKTIAKKQAAGAISRIAA